MNMMRLDQLHSHFHFNFPQMYTVAARLIGSLNCLSPSLRRAGLILTGLTIGAGQLQPQLSWAQTAVHAVSGQTVQGTYNTGVYEVTLGDTQGVLVNFGRANEVISWVILSDPSRVVLQFNGANNQASGSTAVYIRQLAQPLGFDANQVQGDGNSSYFLVQTQSGAFYQFNLKFATGAPPYALVDIIPAPAPAPTQIVQVSQQYQQAVLGQLSRGLAYAEANGLVDTATPAYQNVRQLIALMQSGTPFDQALIQSNTQRDLVSQLRAWGLEQGAPQFNPTPQ